MLTRLRAILLAVIALGLAGCGSITYERARVVGSTVGNPTLGRGVAYQLPTEYALLNPYAPVPALPESQAFENYLRGIVAANDKPQEQHGFRESYLYRAQDRYVVVIHVAINFPSTFRALPPQERALLLPQVAAENRRYFAVPNREQHDEFIELSGRDAIAHRAFLLDAAGPAGRGWIGTGFTFIGDVTDVVAVYVFSRRHDSDAGQADLKVIMDSFRYGAPTAP
ncbi:MAG: hypothetical protein H7067_16055 [Burkholderiales bacterium]|nr:hypothetical protein [Opitutaceae bacterium]